MTHTTEKYGDIGNFWGVTYVILPFVNLKLVGTWAPTAKIIGDIPDFNVLNVPKTQPRHNPNGLYGLYGPCCSMSPERPLNLITHSLFYYQPSKIMHWITKCNPQIHIFNDCLAGAVLKFIRTCLNNCISQISIDVIMYPCTGLHIGLLQVNPMLALQKWYKSFTYCLLDCGFNSLVLGKSGCKFYCMILKHISVTDLNYLSVKPPLLNDTGPLWW